MIRAGTVCLVLVLTGALLCGAAPGGGPIPGEPTRSAPPRSGPDTPARAAPDFEHAADQVWARIADAIGAALDATPAPDAAALVRAIEGLKGSLPPSGEEDATDALAARALRLEHGGAPLWVIAAEWGWSGNVLVAAPDPRGAARDGAGRARVRWTVRAHARGKRAEHTRLDRWAYAAPGYHDGPFAAELFALPPGPGGRARFLVDAVSRSAMGDNRVAQLEVWEWTGAEARPVWLGDYETSDEAHAVRVEGGRIVARTNVPLRSFIACGSCVAPQATWTIEVTAKGVEARARVDDQPELAFVDRLVERVCKGEDTRTLASAAAAAALRGWLGASRESCYVGMLGEVKLEPRGAVRALHVGTDEGAFTFLFEGEGPKLRVRAAQVPPK